MFFVKNLVTAAIAIGSVFVIPEAAEAYTGCRWVNGLELCTVDNGAGGRDRIAVYTPQGVNALTMNVVCTGNGGNRWESSSLRGEFTKSQLQNIANWWCADY